MSKEYLALQYALFLLLFLLDHGLGASRRKPFEKRLKATFKRHFSIKPVVLQLFPLPKDYPECHATDFNSSVYYRVNGSCPLALTTRSYYQYNPPPAIHLKITQYLTPISRSQLMCNTTCAASESTVVNTLSEFYRVLGHRRAESGSESKAEPWCGVNDIREGYWVSRALWSREHAFAHGRDNGNNRTNASTPDGVQLSDFMSGDVSVALTWPYMWVPKRCRTHYYNISSILRCGERLKERTGSPLWIYFMGDSTSEGVFCGLLRMLSVGGECQGAFPGYPCYQGLALNSSINPYVMPYHVEFTYSCPVHHIQLSFFFVHTMSFPWMKQLLHKVFGNRGVQQPTNVIFNTGSWDVYAAPLSNYKGGFEYLPDPSINRTKVFLERPGQMREILQQLQNYGFQGSFIYRSNLCNGFFYGPSADEGVESEVRKFRFGSVLNLFRASECRGTELHKDHLHFDRHFLRRPLAEKPSMGSLNSLVIQGLLNGICNPSFTR